MASDSVRSRPKTSYGDGIWRDAPSYLIDIHSCGATEFSLLASYSDYPEVAYAVPSKLAPNDHEILLMKVRLPEINVVKNSGLLSGHGITKVDGEVN